MFYIYIIQIQKVNDSSSLPHSITPVVVACVRLREGRIRSCGARSVITRQSILPLFTVGRFPLVCAAASAPFVNNNCHFAFSGAAAAAVINQQPPGKYRVSPLGNYTLYRYIYYYILCQVMSVKYFSRNHVLVYKIYLIKCTLVLYKWLT